MTEIDEICVRFWGDLWLWLHTCVQVLAVSRKVKTILGFVLCNLRSKCADRIEVMRVWSD